MKTPDISRSIQIAANLGVIAGIAFLALELRQNNDLLSAQARFNNAQNQMSAVAMIVADGELSDVLSRALQGEELAPGERLRIRQLTLMLLNAWEYEFREFEDGRLTREELKIESKRQDYALFSALAPGVWDGFRVGAHPPFAEFMETEVL